MLTEHLHKIMELIKAMVERFQRKDEAFVLCKQELAALRQVDTENKAAKEQLEAETKVLEDEIEEAMKLIDDITKYLQKQ